ncbi:MAG: SdrD B-like domain-containing protein [Chloroflexota bacterium]
MLFEFGKKQSRFLIGVASFLAVLTLLAPLTALRAEEQLQTVNLLLNPGFEDGFTERGAGEVVVANGWFPWWVQGTPDQTDVGYLRRPEYKPEVAALYGYRRVHGGEYGQKYFNTYSTHVAGIYQSVTVPQGYRVVFTIWAQVWSSSGNNPDEIVDHGDYKVSIGIDPSGGGDGSSTRVVWSEPVRVYNQWVQLEVSAVAQASTVTVFTRGAPVYRVKHNDSYWDDASLVAYAPPPPPPTRPTPTRTPTPTLTPWPTFTPTPVTGTVCALVFEDQNGNGIQDPADGRLSGASITLSDGRGVVDRYVTNGFDEPHCFQGLAPGQYFVSEVNPGGYQSTTHDDWAVSVVGMERIHVLFGDHRPQEATPTPHPTPTPLPPPPTPLQSLLEMLYNASGVILISLALMLIVMLRVVAGGGDSRPG